ncbi:hypothetical protein SG34_023960 [Thalassomonas viridans]|uniref:Uncharacterized protein n=1 Tax=Thalassomonas viridans TaxID=137584 RepID=A0AAF0C6I3_9GAMM|nr:hypothetical protein [Thalassomonas viridans]WDE04362.1 hypothetical protein SG34_023960 [Thalassomonas viridans]
MLKVIKNVAFLGSLFFTVASFANSGKGILNHFYADTASSSNQTDGLLFITNVASEAVTVKVTIYDENGSVVSDQDNNASAGIIKVTNANNFSDGASYSAKFSLAENSTSRLWLDAQVYPGITGYAVIEWEKLENSKTVISNALISHAVMYRSYIGNVGYYSVQVNNGSPF